MFKAIIVAALSAMLFWLPAAAQDNGLIITASAHGVGATLDRLEALFGSRGIGVAARVDHAAAARRADLELRPTQVLIFGNPQLGTPLMQSNPTIGIDLPLKVLAWRDADGKVWVAYNDPAFLRDRHAITDRDDGFGRMAGALKGLVTAATAP